MEKLGNRLSTTLKHDLRTPLNHIIGYCEMLLEEAQDSGQKELITDLERIHRAGRRLLVVINELFDPVTSAAHKSAPELVQHDLRTLLNQIMGYTEMLQEQARELGMEAFTNDCQKILSAARELLRLLVANFATPEMKFGQIEPASSETPTTFLRREPTAPVSGITPLSRHPTIAKTGAILVVDDDESNRAMLSRRLVRLGYTVTVAENGRLALAALQAGNFDLMLLDMQMPELDGYEVLAQLKCDATLPDIPVIVLSATDEIASVARCIEMGAEDYLPKPFDPVLLQARIGATLEKKHLRDREVSHLRQIQEEKQRSDDLLHIILPRDVAAELKATQAVKPRRFENVGVLFCDIVSFTAYCERHAPEEIHTHLQALFEVFEQLVADHGLEKIKTIGDTFMATAGLLQPADNPALNCVRCGLAMIAAAASQPPHWQIRAGVHVGPVIAGVVGRRKFQYDIWGDTVNTAARMLQAAAPDALFVTLDTWKQISGQCEGTEVGRTEIKGKGELILYRVGSMRTAPP